MGQDTEIEAAYRSAPEKTQFALERDAFQEELYHKESLRQPDLTRTSLLGFGQVL